MAIENPERILTLLNIIEKISTVSPRHSYITTEAHAEIHKLDEDIRRGREEEQNRPVTPDPVVEAHEGTITPAEGGDPVLGEVEVSQPIDKPIDTDTPLPEVDEKPVGSAPEVDETQPRRI